MATSIFDGCLRKLEMLLSGVGVLWLFCGGI